MQLNKEAKEAVDILGDSVNAAVDESGKVTAAIEHLRAIGYEPYLTLRLEIALDKIESQAAEHIDDALELTADDVRTLQKLKIRI